VKISYRWLCDQLECAPAAAELAGRLTACGFNVELREPAGDDEVWDVDITANRPDAMNHRGMAREAAAAGCGRLSRLAAGVREEGPEVGTLAQLDVVDTAGCPRYCARVVRSVRVGPSPAWLAERLERCGVRPINNLVDATNYVMLALGQPLHAFDLATLEGGAVVVRRARSSERLVTLDGVERQLTGDDLVIADRGRAIALAGVMGGAATEITAGTTDVLLESAYFDALAVRRMRRRLGVATEASHRFERGADRSMARTAVDVAAALVRELAGGEVARGVLDSDPTLPEPRRIDLSLARLDAFTGCPIPPERSLAILEALGLDPRRDGDVVTCSVPSWRVDLELAEDVYEEVLRHFGYDNIPSRPPVVAVQPGARLGTWPLSERGRDALADVGLAEAFTYSFLSAELEAAAARSPLAAGGGPVPLANPLSARLAVLRRSLLGGLAEAAAMNLRYGAARVMLGEVGRVFFADAGAVREEERLAVAVAGRAGAWDGERAADFLDLKGLLETICERLDLSGLEWRAAGAAAAVLDPAAAALLLDRDGVAVGVAGRVADDVAALLDTQATLWVAEIDLGRAADSEAPRFVAPPRFPAVTADLTARHRLSLTYAQLVAAIRELTPDWLESVEPVVRYRGKGVEAGEVKTTVRLTYRHRERSLTQDEVNHAQFALMEQLAERLGVSFT